MATELFNCVTDYVMMKTTIRLNFALKLGDKLLNDLGFADDLTVRQTPLKNFEQRWQLWEKELVRLGSRLAGAKKNMFIDL